MTIDKTYLKIMKSQYKGEVLEAMLKAWEDNPTYREDCQIKRMEKRYERRKVVKEVLGVARLADGW